MNTKNTELLVLYVAHGVGTSRGRAMARAAKASEIVEHFEGLERYARLLAFANGSEGNAEEGCSALLFSEVKRLAEWRIEVLGLFERWRVTETGIYVTMCNGEDESAEFRIASE